MANVKIMVTGADGFVGRHLVTTLKAVGHSVEAVSRERGDIAQCDLPFSGIDHVFHLAARMFVPDSWKNPRDFYQTNVMGTVNVLEFCRRQGASLTLVSSYVYGHPKQLPISEDHPVAAFNPYGHTKLMAEEVSRFYQDNFRVHLTIIRPFNLYGPGQAASFLIPTLIRQATDPAQDVIRVADARPKRDYLYIDDFVSLLIATLRHDAPGIYNAGSGISNSVEELVSIVNRVTGHNKPLISSAEPRPNEVLDVVADVSRAAEILRWRPRTSLVQGIACMAPG